MPLSRRLVIARRIKTARKEKYISIRKMADSLGISKQTYVDVESGKTSPRLELLDEIAEELNTTTEILIKGKSRK